jgi:DNA-binding YbaB/EbfC family protein
MAERSGPDDSRDGEDAEIDAVEGEIVLPGGPSAGQGGAADPFAALGGLDMGSLLGAAQSMQAQMVEAQEQMAATEVEGQAGGGAVRIVVTGGLEFRSVHIDVGSVDPDDPTLLEDLVLAALHDAVAKVNELQAQASPLGGMDLGGLGDLFGGG